MLIPEEPEAKFTNCASWLCEIPLLGGKICPVEETPEDWTAIEDVLPP